MPITGEMQNGKSRTRWLVSFLGQKREYKWEEMGNGKTFGSVPSSSWIDLKGYLGKKLTHSHNTVHIPLLTPDTVSPFDPRYTFPLSSQKHFFLSAPYTLPLSHTRSLLTYYIRYNSPSYPRYTSPFLFQRHSPLLSQDTLPPFLPQVNFPLFILVIPSLLTPDTHTPPSYPRYTSPFLFQRHSPLLSQDTLPPFLPQVNFPLFILVIPSLLTPDTHTPPSYPRYLPTTYYRYNSLPFTFPPSYPQKTASCMFADCVWRNGPEIVKNHCFERKNL